jgi:hypothetical protein
MLHTPVGSIPHERTINTIKLLAERVKPVSMILFATVSGLPTYNAPCDSASRSKLFSSYIGQPRSFAYGHDIKALPIATHSWGYIAETDEQAKREFFPSVKASHDTLISCP